MQQFQALRWALNLEPRPHHGSFIFTLELGDFRALASPQFESSRLLPVVHSWLCRNLAKTEDEPVAIKQVSSPVGFMVEGVLQKFRSERPWHSVVTRCWELRDL